MLLCVELSPLLSLFLATPDMNTQNTYGLSCQVGWSAGLRRALELLSLARVCGPGVEMDILCGFPPRKRKRA